MVHKLLWTGGFDSTFRLCQLARENCIVEPIYVVDNFRTSLNYEFNAQEKILLFLKNKNVQANIFPVRYVNLQNVDFDSGIDKSFNRIAKNYPITPQYKWLSFFVKKEGYCELCHEFSEFYKGAFDRLMDSKAQFQLGDLGNYRLIKDKTDKDIFNVFGNFLFPLLNISNNEMFLLLKSWGMEEIIDKIWFCYSPINGKPCGLCGPCRNKIKNHMDFLFSKESLDRCFVFNYLRGKRYKTDDGIFLMNLFDAYCREKENLKINTVLSNNYVVLIKKMWELNKKYYDFFEKLLKNPIVVRNYKEVM